MQVLLFDVYHGGGSPQPCKVFHGAWICCGPHKARAPCLLPLDKGRPVITIVRTGFCSTILPMDFPRT